jgi:hypothetical protein
MLTEHQKTIIDFAKKNNDTITKKQALELIFYYCNASKHVGDILSRMVKNNLLIRVKNETFKIGSQSKKIDEIKNQINIEL